MAFEFRYGRFDSPMRFQFKHASASRRHTGNVIVSLTDSNGVTGYGEGCPREYVTAETPASAEAFLNTYGPVLATEVDTLEDLTGWIAEHSAAIDQNPAAFCALETSAIDVMARARRQSTEEFLGYTCKPEDATYTAVLGDTSPLKNRLMIMAYLTCGFKAFKLKLSGNPASDQRRLAMLPAGVAVRVDANNLWQTPQQTIHYIEQLNLPLCGIEEPVQPCDYRSLAMVTNSLSIPVILDESLYTRQHLTDALRQLNHAIINIRISKCGGILRSVALANQCLAAGFDIIIGAQVGETSLLTRAALTAGIGLHQRPLGREGAYGNILLKHDICTNSLRFGRSGVIKAKDIEAFPRQGNGLEILHKRVTWNYKAR